MREEKLRVRIIEWSDSTHPYLTELEKVGGRRNAAARLNCQPENRERREQRTGTNERRENAERTPRERTSRTPRGGMRKARKAGVRCKNVQRTWRLGRSTRPPTIDDSVPIEHVAGPMTGLSLAWLLLGTGRERMNCLITIS